MDDVTITNTELYPSLDMIAGGTDILPPLAAVCGAFPHVVSAHLYDLTYPSNRSHILINAGGHPPEFFTMFIAVQVEPGGSNQELSNRLMEALQISPRRHATTYINFAGTALSPLEHAFYVRPERTQAPPPESTPPPMESSPPSTASSHPEAENASPQSGGLFNRIVSHLKRT